MFDFNVHLCCFMFTRFNSITALPKTKNNKFDDASEVITLKGQFNLHYSKNNASINI